MGEAKIPGPLGGHRGAGQRVSSTAPVGCARAEDHPHAGPSLSFDEFKARVLKRQVRNALAKGRHYNANVPDNELSIIEGKHRMRAEAAARCRDLLKDAREALAKEQKTGDATAKGTSKIAVYSAYRNIAQDTAAWEQCFLQYYTETQAARAAMPGGGHGPKALALMVRMMISFKAAPGYSNHSNGLAVDFTTTHKRKALKARKAQRSQWRKTWLHHWLQENAETYGFHPLSTEEWHWDYR